MKDEELKKWFYLQEQVRMEDTLFICMLLSGGLGLIFGHLGDILSALWAFLINILCTVFIVKKFYKNKLLKKELGYPTRKTILEVK